MDIKIVVTGTSPLLMHNVRLANPMDPAAKALSAAAAAYKRDKTDANFMATAKAEWHGGLYWSERSGVFVPSSWISGSLIRGGVLYGRKGTAVKQGLIIRSIEVPLVHNGPGDLEQLWDDVNFRDTRGVRVGQAVVQRTRPKFDTWSLVAEAILLESALDLPVLQVIADRAGDGAGMGDYRPEKGGPFGRYSAVVEA